MKKAQGLVHSKELKQRRNKKALRSSEDARLFSNAGSHSVTSVLISTAEYFVDFSEGPSVVFAEFSSVTCAS